MINVKRFLCLVAGLAMLFSFTPVSASASSDIPFTDVSTDSQYYDAVKFVYNYEIMNGMTTTTFDLNTTVTRAMFVTILYRLEGEPYVTPTDQFTDVEEGRYYYDAVYWALEEGITTGMTTSTFGPDSPLTKQQVMTFLHRYLTYCTDYGNYELPSHDDINNLNDWSSVGDSGLEAVKWALSCGIVSVYDNDDWTFLPQTAVTRGYCAIYLHRFVTLCLGQVKVFASAAFKEEPTAAAIADRLLRIFSGTTEHAYSDVSLQYHIPRIAMEYAFYNSSIIYSCSHGVQNSLTVDKDIFGRQQNFLSYSDIETGKADQAELIYISACHAGDTFVPVLASTGYAQTAIGFSKKLNSNASSFFDQRFFYYYYTCDYSIESSIENAVRELDEAGYYVVDDGRLYANGDPYFCGINNDTVIVCTYP